MTAKGSRSPLYTCQQSFSVRGSLWRTCRVISRGFSRFFTWPTWFENPRRQQAWNELHDKMSNKRTRNEGNSKGSASAPHKVIVQRLSSEPDNKQTYRPLQPREFVSFSYNDLNLVNIKKACADHFNVPVGSVDVLVSNKGPSATNVNQIPHRKDKVSLSVYLCNTILPSTWFGSSVVVF